MIPRNVINNLKCSLCENTLSIFPIHSFGNKDSVTCGRCPLQQDFLPQRELLYEELAQHIEFPCQYQTSGCIEKLKPFDLENHENNCPHKPCFCPILPLGECKWQGDHTELFEHYTDCHPALAFKEFFVEVDIVTSYEENYVFYQANETFIVQMKCDVAEKKFYCNVICWNSVSAGKKYSYRIRFTDNNMNYDHDVRDVKFGEITFIINNNTTTVNIDDIKLNLNNPMCVICKIDILVKTIHARESNAKLIEEESEMLKTLECPVCFNYMTPPIMQCIAGHSFCASHRQELITCPTCRGSVGETRNYLLEQITNIIEYPCKYNKAGCSYASNAKNIREHEASCIHGPYKCIIESCPWEYQFADLRSHLTEDHKDNILEVSSITYILDEDAQTENNTYILFSGDNLFRLLFRRENNTFMWSLQIVDATENSNYMLELDFDSQTNEKMYIRKHCGPLVDYSTITDDMIVRLDFKQLKHFIIDDLLTYKVRSIYIK